jgi:hypothetical protein
MGFGTLQMPEDLPILQFTSINLGDLLTLLYATPLIGDLQDAEIDNLT